MRLIPLSRGLVAKVDDDLAEYLLRWKWFAHGVSHVYAARAAGRINGVKKVLRMHHEIFGSIPAGMWIDHVDGDGLNNQRSNLRLCDRAGNNQNRRVSRHKRTSRFKGVYKDKGRPSFRARLRHAGKIRNIGTFSNEVDAAKAYDMEAKRVFGSFAKLNFGV